MRIVGASRASNGLPDAKHSCAMCHGFMNVPTLIRGSDGRFHMNPDFEMTKRFHLAAEPYGQSVAAGATQTFTLTVPPEENHLGDFLVNELLMYETSASQDLAVRIFSNEQTREFMNAPVYNDMIFGNATLNCCLPCCFLVQAGNTFTIEVTNNDSSAVTVNMVARGRRFLPKDDYLRVRMLEYWNSLPSSPYFLTLDDQQVLQLAAGASTTVYMTVPGQGDFEAMWARCELVDNGATTYNDIAVTITEGVGRDLTSRPLALGAFVATPTLSVTGFPNNRINPAQMCHCQPFSHLFKRASKIRHTFTNNGAAAATIRMTYAGCMHWVDECLPGRSISRARSLEPTIGPLLVQSGTMCPPVQMPAGYGPDYGYDRGHELPGYGPDYGYGPGVQQIGPGSRYAPPPTNAPLPSPGPQQPMAIAMPAGSTMASQGEIRTAQGPTAYMQKYFDWDPQKRQWVPKHGAAHGLRGLPGGR